jgi:RNA polymerase sigma-70 factor (ECF subfamily)
MAAKKGKLRIVEESTPDGEIESLADDQLMLLLNHASHQEQAFDVLIKRHQQLVLAYATRFLGDRSLAREVTQEVFLTVWTERESYEPRGRFRSYLMTIAFNRCQIVARQRGTARRKQPELESRGEQPEAPDAPIEKLLESERAAQVRAVLLELDDRKRAALILRFCDELSYEEIAAVTGQPQGTVKAQVSRGLKRLREMLCEGHRS